MTVRVLYDGEQIGEVLTVPIAIDEFAADPNPSPNGGLNCSLTASPSPLANGSSFALFLMGLGLTGLARYFSKRER